MLESPGQKKGRGNQSPGPRGSPNPGAKSSSTPGAKSSATPGSKPSPNPRSKQTPPQRPKTPTTPTKGSNSAGKRPQSNPGSRQETPNRTPPLGPQGRQGIQKQQGSGKKSAQPKPDERTRLDDEIRDYMAAGLEQAARRSSSSSGKEKVDEGEVFPKGDKSARLEEPAVAPPKP